MSGNNLVDHAIRELDLLGEEPETIKGYLRVIQAFAEMGHSGGSAACAVPVIGMLLQYRNLTPLTSDPREWNDVGYELWQNARCSEAFSYDGGKTYWLLSDKKRPLLGRRKHKSAERRPLWPADGER